MRTSGYISKAACRGYRPSRHVSHQGRQRPHLIARLAKERSIARFIVAPDGYGKTCLALDYAETMFEWTHVFWFNAQSPCFIRDLDNGELVDACLSVDPDARLVVIDALPQLDTARAQQLSQAVDKLLARKVEVVVTCAPPCDLFGALQIDRLRIGAADLLLNDEEIDAVRTEEERSRLAAPFVPPSCRVPVLVWDGQPASVAAFIAGCLGEGLPADLLLAVSSAFALQKGSIADLSPLGPIDVQLVADVLCDYPHLGFDVETGHFEAPVVEPESLARAVRPRFDAIVERSRCDSRDELVRAWAGVLLDRGSAAARACDLVRTLCPAKRRASWLLEHAYELARYGCFQPTERLISSLKGASFEGRDRIRAVHALCCRMLGDADTALRHAKKCGFEISTSDDARAIGLMIVAHIGPGELRANAEAALTSWACALTENGLKLSPWHEALVVVWAARIGGIDKLGHMWKSLYDASADDDVLCLAASWLFTLVSDMPDGWFPPDANLLEGPERYVRSRLSDEEAVITDFFAASAGLSMEAAHTWGMQYAAGPLEAGVLLGLRRVEMAMLMQKQTYDRIRRDEQVRRSVLSPEGSLYGSRRTNTTPSFAHAVPTLEVKLFGHLELSVGGAIVDPSLIGRKQARVLLAMLVANRGRDLSRDAVAQAMWPTKDIISARKNFYTAWSQLRSALTLSDGTCPYLVRHHFGCRLDERFVKSDVARFDDICRELLFGKLDFEEWRDMYNELDRDFSGEFMPVEERNALIDSVREDRRNRLIDALVTASSRLVEAGKPQWGIWFARSAIERGKTREDAYVALMRAQIASEQRTAAMMTYLNCRRILAEELGIDPSPEMTALYESLLGA
ncbi:MAG: hypothetical protein IKF56_01055 [Eggerthellaceae bacterium]|nr:hypothetical protein [Eggerthellaceae bacterium]